MEDTIDYKFIGWCYDPLDKHDKVWTAFKVGGLNYAGWGKRGKKMAFKCHGGGAFGDSSLAKVMRKKDIASESKGDYTAVDEFQLFSIFPSFEDDVSKYLMFSILNNSVK